MSKGPRIYLAIVAILCVSTGVALFVEGYVWSEADLEDARNFQRAVGGLGMGAVTSPKWCTINYDPRIEGVCTCLEWPIPGGYCYCPDHTTSVSYIEEIPEGLLMLRFVRQGEETR